MGPHLVVFAELLLAGIQASVWVALLVVAIAGISLPAELTDVPGDWGVAVSAVALSLVYSLGVIVDRLADAIFAPWDKRLRRDKDKDKDRKDKDRKDKDRKDKDRKDKEKDKIPDTSMMRLRLVAWKPELTKELEYARVRVRLLRASSLNLAMISVSATYMLRKCASGCAASASGWEVVVGAALLLALASAWGWSRVTKGQYQQLKRMDKIRQGL